MAIPLPTIPNMKRNAVVQYKTPNAGGEVKRDRIPVPDHVTDVQAWLDSAFGNFTLVEIQ